MTYEQLAAIQALEIATIKDELKKCKTAFFNIHHWLFNIGQPLNDNKLGYTAPQMKNFSEIADIIKPFIDNVEF